MDQIARLNRELERIREEVAAELERHILALAKLRVREARTELALQTASKVSTVRPMEPQSRGGAIASARSTNLTVWRKHLQKRRMSLPQWIAAQGAAGPSLEAARSWTKQRGMGGRAIPRRWADALAKEFEAPELTRAESWPCGIRES